MALVAILYGNNEKEFSMKTQTTTFQFKIMLIKPGLLFKTGILFTFSLEDKDDVLKKGSDNPTCLS